MTDVRHRIGIGFESDTAIDGQTELIEFGILDQNGRQILDQNTNYIQDQNA